MATIKTSKQFGIDIPIQFASATAMGWTIVCALSLAWSTLHFFGTEDPWISRGTLVWGHTVSWIFGNYLFFLAYSRLEALLFQAEETWIESEQRLRAVLDNTPICMNLKDTDGRYILVNKTYEDWLGHSSEELMGKTSMEALDNYEEVANLVTTEKLVLKTGKPQETEVTVSRGGKTYHRLLIKYPVNSADGSVNAIGTVAIDITDRKNAEHDLKQHSIIWEQMSEAVLVLDAEGRILDWNPGAERIFGYTKAEAVGKFSDFLIKEEVPGTRRLEINEAISRDGYHRSSATFIRKDGSESVIEAHIMPFYDVHGEIIGRLGVNRDITERLQAEDRLRQAQKMEVVGQLTGGVAHDFNNLLAVVSLNMELLQDEIAGNPRLEELVARPLSAVRRGATLTQRLLSFSRRQSLSPKPTDLGRFIIDIKDMLQRSLGETIGLRTLPTGNTWPVLVDAHQLESAILNLAINARDAMPNGGTLTIGAVNAPLDEIYLSEHDAVEVEDYVLLAISDTGMGIAPSDLEHVFEPFFTTKDVGKGSGLGLSMVYGFVKQSQGHITVDSRVGEGTTVNLYLPRDMSGAVETPSANEAMNTNYGGNECILVVEDEEEVRRLAVDMLRKEGYDVIEVSDGREALDVVRDNGPIDLLFTDVVLPKGISGMDLAVKLEETQPGLNTLFTTGYARSAVINDERLEKGLNLISKPYRRTDLMKMVRSAIDGSAE